MPPWWVVGCFALRAVVGCLLRGGTVDARCQGLPIKDRQKTIENRLKPQIGQENDK